MVDFPLFLSPHARDTVLTCVRTYLLTTLGCKVSRYESQEVRETIERLGLTQARGHETPDLVVVNTCAVTSIALVKSRRAARL